MRERNSLQVSSSLPSRPSRTTTPRITAQRRNLAGACLAHILHDGYTDQLYALLPVWQSQFGLSYAALALVRALYYGTMGGLQVPGDRMVAKLSPRVALALATLIAAGGYLVVALPFGFSLPESDRVFSIRELLFWSQILMVEHREDHSAFITLPAILGKLPFRPWSRCC
jgi:hypothetical protein